MRHDPLQIFKASKSPAGLYARRKWLGESENPIWIHDFRNTVVSLTKGQAANGSWDLSPMETIRRLFGLHLTVRERTEPVDKALGWIIDQVLTGELSGPYLEDLSADAFHDLPFIYAGQPLVQVCATLFLASVFGLENDHVIEAHYRLLLQWLVRHADEEELWPEKCNILRAMIVHPVYARDEATGNLVAQLEQNQKTSGIWPAPIPFFLTVNALGHLNEEAADRQWQKVFPLLSTVQKKDGSWGNDHREWNTFLVVHALKNKHRL